MRVRSFGDYVFVEEAVDAYGSQLRSRRGLWCQQCGAVLNQQQGCDSVCAPHRSGAAIVLCRGLKTRSSVPTRGTEAGAAAQLASGCKTLVCAGFARIRSLFRAMLALPCPLNDQRPILVRFGGPRIPWTAGRVSRPLRFAIRSADVASPARAPAGARPYRKALTFNFSRPQRRLCSLSGPELCTPPSPKFFATTPRTIRVKDA